MIYSKTPGQSIRGVSEFQKQAHSEMSKKHWKSKRQDAVSGAAASLRASLEPNAAAVCYECVFSPLLLNNFQFSIVTSFRFLAVLLDCQSILWHPQNYLTDLFDNCKVSCLK